MLTKRNFVKIAVMMVALLAIIAMCFTACGDGAKPSKVEYVAGSLTKTEFNIGESFDPTGAKIKVTYDNGSEGTLDVTSAMIGNVIFESVGDKEITVNYTENGVTVCAKIAVTVKDPNASAKQTAIARINNNTDVTENANDRGVAALVAEYIGYVQGATTETAINTYVAGFEEKVSTFVAGKKALLDELNTYTAGADGTLKTECGIYEQYHASMIASRDSAIEQVRIAATVEIAQTYVDTFKQTLDAQLKFQEEIQGSEEETEKGQIARKLALLETIDEYSAKATDLVELMETHCQDQENTAKTFIRKYANAGNQLQSYKNYILLTLTLDGWEDEVNTILEDLRTPADDFFDAIKDGITVYPKAYKLEEGEYVLDDENDPTGDLLEELNGYVTEMTSPDGMYLDEDGLKALMEEYVYDDIETVDLLALLDTIQDKYDELTDKQTAAADAIDKIDAAKDAADDAKEAAVAAAWTALKDWNNAAPVDVVVFSEDTTVTAANNLVFDKTYEGVYALDEWSENFDEETTYDFDEDYLKTYFIPNYDDLIAAMLEDLAADLEYIIYSYTSADSDAAISAAEAAIAAFGAERAAEEYPDVVDTVTDARSKYQDRITLANAAITAIDELVDKTIVLEDYADAEGLLKAAYNAYCAFEEVNVDATQSYTDVIAEAYKDTADAYNAEETLKVAMEAYVELAFKQGGVFADARLAGAFVKLIEQTKDSKNFPEAPTALQNDLKTTFGEKREALNAIEFVPMEGTPTDKEVILGCLANLQTNIDAVNDAVDNEETGYIAALQALYDAAKALVE